VLSLVPQGSAAHGISFPEMCGVFGEVARGRLSGGEEAAGAAGAAGNVGTAGTAGPAGTASTASRASRTTRQAAGVDAGADGEGQW
jgi:hypothetical protein